jgi:hypothetical protein
MPHEVGIRWTGVDVRANVVRFTCAIGSHGERSYAVPIDDVGRPWCPDGTWHIRVSGYLDHTPLEPYRYIPGSHVIQASGPGEVMVGGPSPRPASATGGSGSALVLESPDNLEALEVLDDDEQVLARQLLQEIRVHFRGGAAHAYEFSPFSIGAGEFSTRVKNEAMKVARASGWRVSDLDETGGFSVRKR